MMRCKMAMLQHNIAETLQVQSYVRLRNIAGVYFCKVAATLRICSPATFRQWFCNETAKLWQWCCNSSAILRCEIAMLHRIIAEKLQVHSYVRLSNIAGVFFAKFWEHYKYVVLQRNGKIVAMILQLHCTASLQRRCRFTPMSALTILQECISAATFRAVRDATTWMCAES